MPKAMKKIKELRKKIDDIDESIVNKLAQRKNLVKKIMLLKEQIQVSPQDLERENEIIERLILKQPLVTNEIKALYKIIFKSSYKKLRNRKNSHYRDSKDNIEL